MNINWAANDTRVEVCHDLERACVWDEFLNRRTDAHIEQTSGWGKLKQAYGWQPIWTWVLRGETIVAGAMMLIRRIARTITVGYVERGPVCDPAHPDSAKLAVEAMCHVARSLRIVYLAVVPPYSGEECVSHLQSRRFRQKPAGLPPEGVGVATLVIDLRQTQESLLADMSMTKRQNIRRAIRKGVQVRIGDGNDAKIVRDLMWDACQRRGIVPAPKHRDYFDSLWSALGPSGRVMFFMAEIKGEPVSAACVQVFNGTMQLWRVGWSGKYEDYNPNDLLHWEMIRWAREHECHQFDFLHIRPDHARALLRGEKVKDFYSGVTAFKTSFGGALRLLPEIYYRSFHPLGQAAMLMGAARILNSEVSLKALKKISSKVFVLENRIRGPHAERYLSRNLHTKSR